MCKFTIDKITTQSVSLQQRITLVKNRFYCVLNLYYYQCICDVKW